MDIAKHLRIVHSHPDDDLVTKRIDAIRALSAEFSASSSLESVFGRVSAACEIFAPTVKLPDDFAEKVKDAIKQQSVSFVRDGRDLELGVCGILGLMDSIDTGTVNADAGWYTTDVTAASLWSALSFIPASDHIQLEELRLEAIEISRKRILAVGLESRQRKVVPPLGSFGDDHVTAEDFKKAIKPTIDTFQRNTALDREEIDLLWWSLAQTSEIFDKPLDALPPHLRAITIGIEMARFMRCLPAPAHRNLALQHVTGAESVTLTELHKILGDGRTKLSSALEHRKMIHDAPRVFPLLSSLSNEVDKSPGSEIKHHIGDWTLRALLECAVVHLSTPSHRNV